MNVALDARWIFPEISGIGAYTRDLIRALVAADDGNRYTLLFQDAAVADRTVAEIGLAGNPRVTLRQVPYGVFSPVSQLRLAGVLRRLAVDVYHSTNYMVPLPLLFWRGRRTPACVTTIHDVIPLLFPGHAPRSRKARVFPLYRWLMGQVAGRSTCVVTDSEASRRDLGRQLGLAPARAAAVRVVYCGVNPRFRPSAAPPPTAAADAPYRLLYVGRSDPYKNIATLIRVLARLQGRLPRPVELTVAGAPDPRYPEGPRLARELGVADRLRWTGYLSDAAVVETYQQAAVLVHASRYEGFGLQVAEAMACGVPVVCSRAGALPEVAGDAARLCDPDDVEGFAGAIARVLTEPALAATMRAAGLRQAARFTWAQAADAMRAIYAEAATAAGRGGEGTGR